MNVSGVKLTDEDAATLCGWSEVYHQGHGTDDLRILNVQLVRRILSAVHGAFPAELTPFDALPVSDE